MKKMYAYLLMLLASALFALSALAKPLTLEVYNPGREAIFPVTSVLVMGEKEILLVDAQFEKQYADALIKKIRDSGKQLSTIYISHSDPDYYFGAGHLLQAFPDAKLLATSTTIATIASTYKAKQEHWNSTLKDNAPEAIILPKPVTGQEIFLEKHPIHIIGVNEPDPNRTFLWIPSLKTVLGGIPLTANAHPWIADSATAESRHLWLRLLDEMDSLQPKRVIPGHYLLNKDGSVPDSPAVIEFMRNYLVTLNNEDEKTQNAEGLVRAMEKHFPDLAAKPTLNFSAKVIKGEEIWPQ